MKKALRRTIGCISLLAILFSTFASTTPVFSGFNDKASNPKSSKDETVVRSISAAPAVMKKAVADARNFYGTAGLYSSIPGSTCTQGKTTYTYSSASLQSFTVPANVTSVTIEAWGANGGDAAAVATVGSENGTGGVGAYLKGTFNVASGSSLKIIVGQKGGNQSVGNDNSTYSGGGGGGSYVSTSDFTSVSNLLLAAGGGGGGGYGLVSNVSGKDANKDANVNTSGYYGAQASSAFAISGVGNPGGTGGNGGFNGDQAGGGAGILTDGEDDESGNLAYGMTPANGGYGGFGFDGIVDEYGGYGGGGATTGGGGGGGGYSGGGGGKNAGFGGGAGSFLSGAATGITKTAHANVSLGHNGDGLVIITWTIPNPVMAVKGNGNVIANDPTHLNTPITSDNTDFGNTTPGGNITKTFTIHNTGTLVNALHVTGITLTNSLFTLVPGSLPMTIAAGGSASFSVQYSPTAAGTHNSFVNIANDDCVAGTYIYTIKGTATTASAPLLPGTIGSDQTVCATEPVNPIVNITGASGGTGTISYQWQQSTDNSSFTNIIGETSQTYSPPGLTQTTYYRRGAYTATDAIVYTTGSVKITVNPTPAVTAGSNSPVCAGGTINLTSSAAVSWIWDGPNSFASTQQNPSVPAQHLLPAEPIT
jgi:hypothetical protein